MSQTTAERATAPATELPVPETMRAIVYEDYGDPSCLHEARRPVPRRHPGGVLIRVHAAGVNPIDARLRSGEARWMLPGGFPRVPGFDVAGEVVETAQDDRLRVGDRVLAFLDSPYGGGYAEYAACSLAGTVKIPDDLPIDQAAGLPLAGSTALQGLRDKGRIFKGDRVLVNGASGGVGSLAVQIAKAEGAQVTGVASGRHETFVRELGADEFIDYQKTDFTQSDAKFEIVFDAAGKSSYRRARPVLAPGGRFVTTEPSLRAAFLTAATQLTSKSGRMLIARPRQRDLATLVELVSSGKLRIPVADVAPLWDAAEIHRRLQQGGHRGKYVLRVVVEEAPGGETPSD